MPERLDSGLNVDNAVFPAKKIGTAEGLGQSFEH
jgi:hypothetical protein